MIYKEHSISYFIKMRVKEQRQHSPYSFIYLRGYQDCKWKEDT
jgi:hypothetical protein